MDIAGYIEFGQGEEILGIIAHLDVVPAKDSWTFPPFHATITDGKIYGRGAIDDKGPVMASLYAMKTIMDNCNVNKRVRLILGLNEENDWKCIEYYKKKEEAPSFGFSPDADFPCIYAEKGLLNVFLYSHNKQDSIQIIHIDCHNNPINVVPKYCSITLLVDNCISCDDCMHNLKMFVEKYNFNIDIKKEHNRIILTSYGISAHAAHPDLGKNAISQVLIILYELFQHYSISNSLLSYFYEKIGLEYDGKSLGINLNDESGFLTLNVANLTIQASKLVLGMNLRIPIHTNIETIKEKILASTPTFINTTFSGEKKALYLPKNHWLVQTLCHVFNNTTKLNASPITIGGATYARAFPNFVSFGSNMPNQKDMCHQVDEFISIDNLILATNIYANAIYELCC